MSQHRREAKNNTRATMEGLVFTNEKGEVELSFIECNRRPQVENEALALLQQDSDGNRRYTFAGLNIRSTSIIDTSNFYIGLILACIDAYLCK